MRIKSFEDIIAWRKAKDLTIQLRTQLGSNSDYVFKDQIFRASLSTMNNIAEGFDRQSDKEFRHFLYIARGSNAEVRSMLAVAQEMDYLSINQTVALRNTTNEISKIPTGFIKKLD